MKSPPELSALLRSRGLKVTPQRERIFRALHDGADHPTADAVYAAVAAELPTISLRTVYQTLNDLVALGELSQLDVGAGPVRFDTTVEPHHHLVCESCGRVVDIHSDFPAVTVPAEFTAEFEVTATEIVFRGRCRACLGVEAGADRPHHPSPSHH